MTNSNSKNSINYEEINQLVDNTFKELEDFKKKFNPEYERAVEDRKIVLGYLKRAKEECKKNSPVRNFFRKILPFGLVGALALTSAAYGNEAKQGKEIKPLEVKIEAQKEIKPLEVKIEEKAPEKHGAEIYLIGGNSFMNPVNYNSEIRKVSASADSEFSDVIFMGVGMKRKGIAKPLDFRLNSCIELTFSNQEKKSYVQNINTQELREYGSNSLMLLDANPSIEIASRKKGLLGVITPTIGIGPCLELAILKSKNEDSSLHSEHFQLGIKPYASYEFDVGIAWVGGKVAYKEMFYNKIDTSGLELGVTLGLNF